MQTTTVTADGGGSGGESGHIARRDLFFVTTDLGTMDASFSPPSGCESLMLDFTNTGTIQTMTFNYGQQCLGHDRGHIETCYPTGFVRAFDDVTYPDGSNKRPVYSPASSCPSGYVSACGFAGTTATANASSSAAVSGRSNKLFIDDYSALGFERVMTTLLRSTQTAVGCCISGYECFTDRPFHCISRPKVGAVITADANEFCDPSTVKLQTFTALPNTVMYAAVPCIVLVQNKPQFVSATATTSSTKTSSTTNAASSPNNPAETAAPSGGGLSTGVKAAIGVCVPVFAVLAGLALFVFLRRRSRRRAGNSAEAAAAAPSDAHPFDKAEMDGSDPRQSTITGSPSERVVSVLSDSSVTPSQSASGHRTSELPGSVPLSRLHEDIMELPAETPQPVARKPVAGQPE